jgi:hypothetical protein
MKPGHARTAPAVVVADVILAAVVIEAAAGMAVIAAAVVIGVVVAVVTVALSHAGNNAGARFVVSRNSVVSQFCNFSLL